VDDDYLSPQREVTLGTGCGTSRSRSLGNSSRYPRGGREPSSNDPFPEADVAVIIMNRFLIALMFAPPTKRYQLVGDPIPPPSKTPNHQHKWQKD
jgi:hypothetical protein